MPEDFIGSKPPSSAPPQRPTVQEISEPDKGRDVTGVSMGQEDKIPKVLDKSPKLVEKDTILSMAVAIDDYVRGQLGINNTYLSKFATQTINKRLQYKITIYSKTVGGLRKRASGRKKTFEEVGHLGPSAIRPMGPLRKKMENEIMVDRSIVNTNLILQHQKIFPNLAPNPREGGRIMSLLSQLPKSVYRQFSLIEDGGTCVPIRNKNLCLGYSESMNQMCKVLGKYLIKNSTCTNCGPYENLRYV